MSQPSFISVQKVVIDKEGVIKKSPDTIRLDWLKSARPWKKSKREEDSIKEDMTVLYMINPEDKNEEDEGGRTRKTRDAIVKIAESKDDFDKRIGAIRERFCEGMNIKKLSKDGE